MAEAARRGDLRRGAPARRRPARPLRRPLRHHQPHPHQGGARDGGPHPVRPRCACPWSRRRPCSATSCAPSSSGRASCRGPDARTHQEDRLATATRGGVRVIPLGGAGEIGKNMYVIEYDGRMVVIDCGITFPKNDQMGVDIVLPDFGYVVERRDALEAIILTHGHEDHIGAVPFLLRAVGQVPIYGRRFTLALLRREARRAPPARGRRADRGAPRPRGRRSGPSTSSSCRSPTAPRTAPPWRSPVRAARSCTPGDFGIEYAPVGGLRSDLPALARLGDRRRRPAPGRLHQRRGGPAALAPARPGACATSWRASSRSPAAECWSRPSPPTSTACSRCSTPRTPTAGASRWWAARSPATSESRPT